MSNENKNLDLWNRVFQTKDPKYVKPIKNSTPPRKSVDAQYKKMLITAEFGPYGSGWGIVSESEHYERVHYSDSTCILQYNATAFYVLDGKECKLPIAAAIKEAYITNQGKGYLKIDDEATKKVRTDALTKAFTDVGFCADINMGKFDDQDYIEGVKARDSISKAEEEEEAFKIAYADMGNYCKEQTESIKDLVPIESRIRARNRIISKVTARCNAARMNPEKFIMRINQLIPNEEPTNESK